MAAEPAWLNNNNSLSFPFSRVALLEIKKSLLKLPGDESCCFSGMKTDFLGSSQLDKSISYFRVIEKSAKLRPNKWISYFSESTKSPH